MCLFYRVRGHQRPSHVAVSHPSRWARRRSKSSASIRSSCSAHSPMAAPQEGKAGKVSFIVWVSFFMRLVYRVRRQDRGQTVPPPQPSQLCHHVHHLCRIDLRVVPCHAVTGLTQAAPNLTLSHATDELLPRGLALAAILNTCLSGVVQKLIVANPEGGIPGFVVGPTVVGSVGVGHRSGRLVDVFILQGQRGI